MTYTIDLSIKAQKELFEAWKWYEDEQVGLGEKFVREVFRKAKLVQNNPLKYESKGTFREAITATFPYLVVFRIIKSRNQILIVSIFHTSRHPKKKF